MLNYSMTNSLVVPLQLYFIWTIKIQWVCILINRLLWRYPHMVLTFFLTVHVWNRLFIWIILFYTLVYLSAIKATFLEILNMLLTVPSTCMPSYISVTILYLFIDPARLLHLRWLAFTMSLEEITHLVSYQIIGYKQISGEFFSHFYFVW